MKTIRRLLADFKSGRLEENGELAEAVAACIRESGEQQLRNPERLLGQQEPSKARLARGSAETSGLRPVQSLSVRETNSARAGFAHGGLAKALSLRGGARSAGHIVLAVSPPTLKTSATDEWRRLSKVSAHCGIAGLSLACGQREEFSWSRRSIVRGLRSCLRT